LVQAAVAVLMLGKHFLLLPHFCVQNGKAEGRSQFPPLLGPDKIFGAELYGSTYSKKFVNRKSCSSLLTSVILSYGEENASVWGGKQHLNTRAEIQQLL